MPRIVIDARGLTFRPSGARTRLTELLGAYVARDDAYDIEVWTLQGRGAQAVLGQREVPVREWPSSRWSQTSTGLFVRAGRTAPDLLHLETMPIPVLQTTPVVLTIHDLRSVQDRAFASSWLKGVYERHLLPRVAGRITTVVAVSSTTARAARDHLRLPVSRIAVVPNGVSAPPPPVPPLTLLEGRPYLLALGHLEPRKNLGVLVPAIAELCHSTSGRVRDLVVAGADHGVAAALEQTHRRLGADTRLHLLLDVTDDERERLLRHATCLVAPSLIEGFGLVPLEAMARGVPVVAADTPTTREVLGGAASLVDGRDPRAIADAVQRILMDPAQRAIHARASADVVARYSWRRSAALLHHVYSSVLGC